MGPLDRKVVGPTISWRLLAGSLGLSGVLEVPYRCICDNNVVSLLQQRKVADKNKRCAEIGVGWVPTEYRKVANIIDMMTNGTRVEDIKRMKEMKLEQEIQRIEKELIP